MELIVFIHVRQTAIMKCAIMSMDHVLVNLDGKGPTVAKVNSMSTDISFIKSSNSSS